MNWYNDDKDLLRQIIITHYDAPLHKISDLIELPEYRHFHNKSASCIDDFEVFIKLDNNIITDAKFYGLGCAISTASIDILCELLINKTIVDATDIFKQYRAMIAHEAYDDVSLDELIAFKDIYQQPNRIKCALIGIDCFEHILKVK